ncbi:RICIN domain-containing protein [Streptomyces similanensis]|uniref:RICIN domain-containing protein n=1 Tax=Streptomyces similanensis TaxID=1274988 RepID=A0ABP9JSC0_9ACTN
MHRQIKDVRRLLAAPLVALAMLTTGVIASATTARAADSAAWTFTNPDGTLNATGTGDGAQISVTPDGTNYTNWRLIAAGTGTFRVANTNTGRCLYSVQPLVQRSCGGGDSDDGQLWHFHPVTGKPNAFRLVRTDESYCLDNRGGLHLWGILAQPNPCDGSAGQEWTVPQAKAPEALKLALDYYADLCSRKTSTCSWTEKSEGQPEVLPRQPASSIWYNDTDATMKQVFTTIYHSGWAQSYSVGLSSSVGVSAPVQAMVTSQLNATQTYTSDETTVNGISIDVPPKNYGWVDFAAVGKKVTGTWTFDADHQPWTADATVTVPVINSAAGSTMYVARTSANAPGASAGTGGADVKPAVIARTASAAVDVPEGGRLTAYQGGIRVSDADGSTVATVMPGTVIDTDGQVHKISFTLNGTTVTQNVEGVTGDTVTGTITPPAFSLGDSAATGSAAAEKSVRTMSAASFEAAAAARNSDAHDKCMAAKIGTSIVSGGVMGLLSGPPGVATGMMTGAFSGIVMGLVTCPK